MAVPLMQKKSFVRSGEGSVASYSWTDVADGTGVVVFYGAGGTGSDLLVTQTMRASSVEKINADVTFALTAFNTPRTVKGIAYVSGSVAIDYSPEVGKTVTITIMKNGASIGSAATPAVTAGSPRVNYLLPITLTQTNFAIGDVLSISMTWQAGVGTPRYIGTDPLGRDGLRLTASVDMTTQTKFYIPFKIDL